LELLFEDILRACDEVAVGMKRDLRGIERFYAHCNHKLSPVIIMARAVQDQQASVQLSRKSGSIRPPPTTSDLSIHSQAKLSDSQQSDKPKGKVAGFKLLCE
jgi:hypothetical protein